MNNGAYVNPLESWTISFQIQTNAGSISTTVSGWMGTFRKHCFISSLTCSINEIPGITEGYGTTLTFYYVRKSITTRVACCWALFCWNMMACLEYRITRCCRVASRSMYHTPFKLPSIITKGVRNSTWHNNAAWVSVKSVQMTVSFLPLIDFVN